MRAHCEALAGSIDRVIEAIDGRNEATFQRVIEGIERSLAEKGQSFWSTEHIQSVAAIPLSATMKKAFESLADRSATSHRPSSAVDLLIAALEQDSALRKDFMELGLPLEKIQRELPNYSPWHPAPLNARQ